MEQQEEKKLQCYGRRRRRTQSFPLDLTSEILLRLPEKSVARFRCVSKLWSSITTDPYFINLFESRSPQPSLLLCIRKDDKFFVSSIPQHTYTLHQKSNKSHSSSQPIDRYHMKIPDELSFLPPTESVHGLVCFQGSATPIVWNPSKRQLLTLPKPRKSWNNIDITVLLGYDPIERKHKVVCMPLSRSCDACRVLTLGSAQESWRTVKTKHKHRSSVHTSGRCIKGVIYYLAYVYHTRVWVIMSFDVRSEIFSMIELPANASRGRVMTYDGKLACVGRNYNGRRSWILEDAENHKWSSHNSLSLPLGHYNKNLFTYFNLTGCTHAGEFVFVPSVFGKSLYVLFWDPVRNSFRRFVFEGIVDDESGINNGVEDGFMYDLHAFPNHIESQISLL